MSNIEIGKFGQGVAEKFLRDKGYELLEENFCAPGGEIDLIMKDGSYIVFIEVKFRQNENYGLPREAVGKSKQQRIKKTAMHYIKRKRLDDADFRFDVVEMLGKIEGIEVEHIENAFW